MRRSLIFAAMLLTGAATAIVIELFFGGTRIAWVAVLIFALSVGLAFGFAFEPPAPLFAVAAAMMVAAVALAANLIVLMHVFERGPVRFAYFQIDYITRLVPLGVLIAAALAGASAVLRSRLEKAGPPR